MELRSLFPERDDVPPVHRVEPCEQREYLVGGELRTWGGPLQEVHSPVCLRSGDSVTPPLLGGYPLLGEREALEAVDAAAGAWDSGRGAWPTMGVEERLRAVSRFAGAMIDRRAEIVRWLMWEIGKTYPDACREFDRTVEYIQATVDAVKELDRAASRLQMVDGIYAQIRRAPYGVTLCMGPFNYPLNETFTTLIPALVMGNTVVFKPAKYGVLLLRPLLEAFRACFPPGVVNTVYGDGRIVVTPIMKSGKVDVLAFIGSAAVSNVVQRQHPAPNRLRTVLGLNAKNPAIVLDDADLDLAVRECVLGALSYNGQRCTALKILFVQRPVAAAFVARLAAAVSALPLGMPWTEGAVITPLAETGKTAWLRELVDDAVARGSSIVNEGGGASAATLYRPAVLYPIAPTARLFAEEQFGPLVPVVPFDDLREPIEYVTASSYGQQASLFSTSADRLAALIDPLANQVCRINVNSQCQRGPDVFPFTGRKDSADGTLSVSDALRVFSIRTLVAAKQGPLNDGLLRAMLRGRKSSFLNTDFIL